MTPPRLFGIPARDAPVVAVLRRGPSGWCQLGRWTVGEHPSYEPGSWLRATLYPQRCDLSPDGRWLVYVALGGRADWPAGAAYVAVSRLPWATALAAWGLGSTWTHGAHLVDDTPVWELGDPDVGDAAPLRARHGLALVRAPASFAVERRRGWLESADSPPFTEDDRWETRRAPSLTMVGPAPRSGRVLEVSGSYAAFRSFDEDVHGPFGYRLAGADGTVPLDDVQWADWSPAGELLVATRDGRLQVRSADAAAIRWEQDLSGLTPDPQPPPPEAHRW